MTPSNRQTPEFTALRESAQGFFILLDVLGHAEANRELQPHQLVPLYHGVLNPPEQS